METVSIISRIFLGEAIRATPPWARIWAGTRSSAMTAAAPAFSAISAWPASVTSIMTPPLSISARPVFSRNPVLLPFFSDIKTPFAHMHDYLYGLTLYFNSFDRLSGEGIRRHFVLIQHRRIFPLPIEGTFSLYR